MNSDRESTFKRGSKKPLIYVASALLIPLILFVVITYSLKPVSADTAGTGEKGFWAHLNDSISSTFSGSSSDNAKSAGTKKLSIPSNSWYRKASPLNYFSSPSPEDILRKVDELAESEGLPIPESIVMKGKVSMATGYAYSEEGTKFLRQLTTQRAYSGKPALDTTIKDPDSPQELYESLGTIDTHFSKDDKVHSKVVINLSTGPYSKVEKIEALNGTNGWNREIAYDRAGRMVKNELKSLNPKAISELKARTTGMWQKKVLDKAKLKYIGVEKVGFTPCFVLSQNTGTFTEKFYFDAVSGAYTKADLEEVSIYFGELSAFNGIKMPRSLTYRRTEEQGFYSWLKIDIDDLQLNQPIDESLLQMPAE